MTNPVRFGQDFIGRVANPRDILQYYRRKKQAERSEFIPRSHQGGTDDKDRRIIPMPPKKKKRNGKITTMRTPLLPPSVNDSRNFEWQILLSSTSKLRIWKYWLRMGWKMR
jgi:hypothetical protein